MERDVVMAGTGDSDSSAFDWDEAVEVRPTMTVALSASLLFGLPRLCLYLPITLTRICHLHQAACTCIYPSLHLTSAKY